MIKLGELDSEQHFVGTDGWFGEVPDFPVLVWSMAVMAWDCVEDDMILSSVV